MANTKMMVRPIKQDVQRDLVRRFLPLGAFDQPDHAVEEGRAGRRGDAHADPVGQHLGAAGHRRAVAAGLADDRRRFTGDRGFVDRGHAFDDFAVGRDHVAGFDQDNVADFQPGRGHELEILPVRAVEQFGLGLAALPAQGVGLRLAAAFGDGLGEVGEQHGEPQPQDDLKLEQDVSAARHQIADQNDRGQGGDDLEHEHHRVLHERAWIELDERGADRRQHDLRIEQRRNRHALAQG